MSTDREGWRFDSDRRALEHRSWIVRRPVLALLLVGIPAAAAFAIYEAGGLSNAPAESAAVFGQLTLYWALWLAWGAAALFLARVLLRVRAGRIGSALVAALGLALSALLIWSRFIEPARLRVTETPIGSTCGVRVAVVSDLHLGLYWRSADLERLVAHLNSVQVDAVLVAGDWTLAPPRDIAAAFAPWVNLKHRSIGVPGHQDERTDGPRVRRLLEEALKKSGLEWANGRRLMLGQCELIGLGDLRAGSAAEDVRALQAQRSSIPAARRVVLMHDAAARSALPSNWAALAIVGNAAQPQFGLDDPRRPAAGPSTGAAAFSPGLHAVQDLRLFVASGVGLELLPMRLGRPPTIDVLLL